VTCYFTANSFVTKQVAGGRVAESTVCPSSLFPASLHSLSHFLFTGSPVSSLRAYFFQVAFNTPSLNSSFAYRPPGSAQVATASMLASSSTSCAGNVEQVSPSRPYFLASSLPLSALQRVSSPFRYFPLFVLTFCSFPGIIGKLSSTSSSSAASADSSPLFFLQSLSISWPSRQSPPATSTGAAAVYLYVKLSTLHIAVSFLPPFAVHRHQQQLA
jgi:hypothetical protein